MTSAQGTETPGPVLGASDCEAVSAGLLAQPAAALSSLAFVVAAIVLVTMWRGHRTRVATTGWAYALVLALVGVGSLDYHGTQSPAAGLLHDLPVAVVVALAVAVPVGRRARGRAAFGRAGRGARATSGLLGALALGAFALGRTGGPLCDPAALLQPHAAWHVLAAAALAAWALLLWPADHVLYPSRYCTTCRNLSRHRDASWSSRAETSSVRTPDADEPLRV